MMLISKRIDSEYPRPFCQDISFTVEHSTTYFCISKLLRCVRRGETGSQNALRSANHLCGLHGRKTLLLKKILMVMWTFLRMPPAASIGSSYGNVFLSKLLSGVASFHSTARSLHMSWLRGRSLSVQIFYLLTIQLWCDLLRTPDVSVCNHLGSDGKV